MKEKRRERTSSESRRLKEALLNGPFSHRGNGTCGIDLLQEAGSHDFHEERTFIYQKVITWIRQRLTFSLLRSAISAIKATRLPTPPPPDPTKIAIVTSEGRSTDY